MMDNSDGRMLETGLKRDNFAPVCRDREGNNSSAQGLFLVLARPPGATHGPLTETEGERGKA